MEGEWQGCEDMAKQKGMTLDAIVARKPDVDLAKIDATTEEDIRRMGQERGGVIRLSTECYTCYHWLPPLLKKFRQVHPRVDVRIDVEATHHPIERMLEGKLELAIMSSPVSDRRLASRLQAGQQR